MTMADIRADGLPAAVESWLERARAAIVARASEYSPPGARPGRPPAERQPVGLSREVRFVFVSDTKDPVRAWKATLVVPPNAGVGTELTLSIVNADGTPVEDGSFRVSGCAVPVKAGRGAVPFEVFVGGLRNVHVALTRRSCPAEGGVLSFFCGEDA